MSTLEADRLKRIEERLDRIEEIITRFDKTVRPYLENPSKLLTKLVGSGR